MTLHWQVTKPGPGSFSRWQAPMPTTHESAVALHVAYGLLAFYVAFSVQLLGTSLHVFLLLRDQFDLRQ